MMNKLKINLKAPEKEEKFRQVDPDLENKIFKRNKNREMKIQMYYNEFKKKRLIMSILFYSLIIFIIVFGIWNTFIRKDKTPVQLATEVNTINGDTSFKNSGVEGFLKENIVEIFKKKSYTVDGGASDSTIDPNTVLVKYISKKSFNISNVYFKAKVVTSLGEKWYDFVIPVYYDRNTTSYAPAGNLSIILNPIVNKIKNRENVLLEFNKEKKMGESEIKEPRLFVENFLKSMYNTDIDLSQSYKNSDFSTLNSAGSKYKSMGSFDMYSQPNALGFNVVVEYNIITSTGFGYSNTLYMSLSKSGKSYVINKIM